MAELTHPDARLWKDEAIAWLVEHRANLIIEDTCKDSQEMVDMVQSFRQVGYSVEIHALAVSESESRVGIMQRYLHQVEKDGIGRTVPVDRHDQSYEVIPVAVQRLESEGLVDYLAVYNRDGKIKYSNMLDGEGNLVGSANSEVEINKLRDAELDYTETIKHMQTLDRLQQAFPQQQWQHDIAQVRQLVTKQANASALNRCASAAFPRLVDPAARAHVASAKASSNPPPTTSNKRWKSALNKLGAVKKPLPPARRCS